MTEDSTQKDTQTENEDFAQLLAEHEIERNTFQPGQKVTGKVIAITRDNVFIDLGIKQDGVMDRAEILDDEGRETVSLGDNVEAWITHISPQGPRLSKSMTGSGTAALEEAKDAGIPVEGRIIGPCKGGYQVEVLGKTAFCPGSQMQNLPGVKPEEMAGRFMQFLITRVEHNGRNIVVSRRALVERERKENIDKLLKNINIGDIVDGRITRLTSYGAFMELAPGIEGLAHISELSWSHVDNPGEMFAAGDNVRVKITSMENDDKGNLRVGLSVKQAMGDPWDDVLNHFAPGDIVKGKVRRLTPFGAFIEVSPGVEGLAHISEFSWDKRIHKPEDMLNIGDEVNVKIRDIMQDSRRLSLSIRDAQGDPWEDAQEKFAAGNVVKGVVENRGPAGVFINLAPGVTGLLPASVLAQSGSKYANLKPGEETETVIKAVDAQARKISLAPLAEDTKIKADTSWKSHLSASGGGKDLGIMAQALQKALQKKQ